jgi:hypothetical protein
MLFVGKLFCKFGPERDISNIKSRWDTSKGTMFLFLVNLFSFPSSSVMPHILINLLTDAMVQNVELEHQYKLVLLTVYALCMIYAFFTFRLNSLSAGMANKRVYKTGGHS